MSIESITLSSAALLSHRGTAVSGSIRLGVPSLFIMAVHTIHNSKCVSTPSAAIWNTQHPFIKFLKSCVFVIIFHAHSPCVASSDVSFAREEMDTLSSPWAE